MSLVRSTEAEARARADAIRSHADTLWGLLLQAWEHEDHLALGYDSWKSYIAAEFDMSRSHSYRLLDTARVMRAIGEAVGEDARDDTAEGRNPPSPGVEVSHNATPVNEPARNAAKGTGVTFRQAKVLKRDTALAVSEIAAAVNAGKPVAEAIRGAVQRREPEPIVVDPNSTAPDALKALLELDPTKEGAAAGRTALGTVKQARAWLDRFEGAAIGVQPMALPSSCRHPVNRLVGKFCMACGTNVRK